MSHIRIRRVCRDLLNSISTFESISIEKICEAVAGKRGRRLYVHPITIAPTSGLKACGMLIATEIADHIFVEEQTSKFHQTHIILHEIGHMLCGHATEDYSSVDLGQLTQEDHPDMALIEKVLARTSYNTRQEHEAEMVGSIILERVSSRNSRPLERSDLWIWTSLGIIDD